MTGSTDEFKLALVRYLHQEFGYEVDGDTKPFEQLASDFKGGAVDPSDTNPENTEWFSIGKHTLVTSDSSLSTEQYRRYDSNINSYLDAMNENRAKDISFRYYQYLAVLFTEYLFDMHFNQGEFLEGFTEYIHEEFAQLAESTLLAPEAIDKIAYWMATGSGKTIIMHTNIMQLQNYVDEREYDNIILIAPSEEVAAQHREKFSKSGIPNVDIRDGEHGPVQVTDVHKLEMNDSGPKTVDITQFGESNIILVDEGHKGLGSTQSESGWVHKRDYLSNNGFAFEYSATFASSLSSASGYQEYSRSIIFDYPYGRFHKDGYGKDYNILNISPGSDESEFIHDEQNRWLLANLISYYEKLVICQQEYDLANRHNIEKPLSVFIGNSVNSSSNYNSDKDLSDVQQVVEFLGRVVSNPNSWVESVIREILSASNEFSSGGLFGDRFDYLREHFASPSNVYNDLVSRVFESKSPSQLEAVRLTNLEDEEIGLTTDVTDNYIGVVTIGDTRSFFQRLEEADNQVHTIENRMHSSSLFESIDSSDTSINLLIGSKKFAEGWDSTRPSSMGLLNLGRSEGPLVVQMFGRGVRVNGEAGDGKRADTGQYCTSRLETLDVFGIRADYMEEFKEHLKSERVEIEDDTRKVSVDVDSATPELSSNLQVPKLVSDTDMDSIGPIEVGTVIDSGLHLSPDEEYAVNPPNLRIEPQGTKVTSDSSDDLYQEDTYGTDVTYHSFSDGLRLRIGDEIHDIPLDWLDWDAIWQNALNHKSNKRYRSLLVSKSDVKRLIADGYYDLKGPEGLLELSSFDELDRINSICAGLVAKFLDNVHSAMVDKATYKTVQLEPLDSEWISERIDAYEVEVKSATENEGFISELETDGWNGESDLEDVFKYLNQMYMPVFLDSDVLKHLNSEYEEKIAGISPEGIDNMGEKKFIDSLEHHIQQGELEDYAEQGEVMVLRNQASAEWVRIPRGTGDFYPDFVIWVCAEGEQHIILADPHGMVLGGGTEEDIKAINRVNKKETEKENVHVHACLFARSMGQETLDEARRAVADNANMAVDELEENGIYLVDDTVDGMGKTTDEIGRMLRQYLE